MSSDPPAVSAAECESQIRALIDDWREALAARDLDRLMAHYDPEVVFFDAVPPFRHQGAAAYRGSWEAMLPYLPAQLGSELKDLTIEVSGGLAVMHALQRLIDRETGQAATCGWVRVTVIYRQLPEGSWRVIHEHVSVPFDPQSGQAAFMGMAGASISTL